MSVAHGVDIRSLFPTIADGKIAYLDSAATAQTPDPVIAAMTEYYTSYRASIHRGVYDLATRATDAYEAARDTIAAFTGSTAKETIFTRNATEAINLVAYAWGGANLKRGDLVVVTEMEHHSNIVSWQLACQRAGAELAYVRVTDSGHLDSDHLDELLARGPKAVGVVHASNVLGTINPVAEIVRRARAAGAITLIDGSQAVPHLPVDVAAIDADFYAWTGHKLYGPTGIGVLHGKAEVLDAMPPFIGGGHMIAKVSEQTSTYAESPAKFEAGTGAIAEAIGLAAACDFVTMVGIDLLHEHDLEMSALLLEKLHAVEGVTVHGPVDPAERVALASFEVAGVHPHDVAEILGSRGVCVRAGHHCAQPLMRRLGSPASSRASTALHTTPDELDRLVAGIGDVQRIFA
ncbi:MAG: cysteine desulfurase / selenocysteine lyase [Solirubrobacteraceae bacterium]|jgi:cysteine desulfurase/selenocysteine lyase|nr:cysteine desulfurase / selenocysteine lyase [Solirubrobacteraceae bacterium]